APATVSCPRWPCWMRWHAADVIFRARAKAWTNCRRSRATCARRAAPRWWRRKACDAPCPRWKKPCAVVGAWCCDLPAPSRSCASPSRPPTRRKSSSSPRASPKRCRSRPRKARHDRAATVAMNRVPTLDIRRYDNDRDAFVAELGTAYREYGFCGITGHGVAPELVDGAYDAFVRFFALPTQTKMRYHVPGTGGARGYTPYKVETAKDSEHPDLKEFWHIGRELPDDSPYRELMPPNLWPAEVPDFRECGYGLYEALDALGTRVLRVLALHIGLPERFFDDKTNTGNSILRPIHYPPIESGDVPNVRAGAHEDINFITLLVGTSAA